MPSCSSSDLKLAMASTTLVAANARSVPPGRCWREDHCEEVAAGRPACPPDRCRYGGREHARIPCPDHERNPLDELPFGHASGHASAAGDATRPERRKRPGRKPRAKTRVRARTPARPARRKPAKRGR